MMMDTYSKLNYNAILIMMRNQEEIGLREFAKLIDTDYSYLSRIENGYEASETIYEHAFSKFNLELSEIDDLLHSSNENLLHTIHVFCHLTSDACHYDDSMCVDALINNILINVINNTMANNIKNAPKEDLESIRVLDACWAVLNDHQKAACILLKLYYSLLTDADETYNDLLKQYKQLSPSPFMAIFFNYIVALKFYFHKQYYKAILALHTTKNDFLNAYLFNWGFIVNYLLFKIARSINDEMAMKELYGHMKEYSEIDIANASLCASYMNNLK